MFNISRKQIVGIVCAVFAVVVLCMLGRIGEDVKYETIVVNQFPFSGRMEYWTDPGWKAQLFGKTTTYHKTEQLWFGGKDINDVSIGSPIPVRFYDGSEGLIYGSLRVKLPTDMKYLSKIQTDYNGMDRLMNDLIKQTVGKVIYATGALMTGFESYAEKKNDFLEYVRDQLTYGVYKTNVKIEEVKDQSGNIEKLKIASLIVDTLAPNGYKRSEPSPFMDYGIEVGQVSISTIDYSQKVKDQIAQQQESNMLAQTAKAKAAAAAQEAIRAEEEGKAKAAQAKWAQETIKATEVTKAEQEKEVSRLAAEKAEYDKKKVIAQGEAEAAANRAKVAAGLTPQEKAEWDYKTKVGVADAIAKVTLPKIVMTDGGNGSNGTAMEAMGFKMLLDVADKLSK
jgi:regulator of protease activity HflC (stomatin/prohibitin superfamily)